MVTFSPEITSVQLCLNALRHQTRTPVVLEIYLEVCSQRVQYNIYLCRVDVQLLSGHA
jgi:hypothetical protein